MVVSSLVVLSGVVVLMAELVASELWGVVFWRLPVVVVVGSGPETRQLEAL